MKREQEKHLKKWDRQCEMGWAEESLACNSHCKWNQVEGSENFLRNFRWPQSNYQPTPNLYFQRHNTTIERQRTSTWRLYDRLDYMYTSSLPHSKQYWIRQGCCYFLYLIVPANISKLGYLFLRTYSNSQCCLEEAMQVVYPVLQPCRLAEVLRYMIQLSTSLFHSVKGLWLAKNDLITCEQ